MVDDQRITAAGGGCRSRGLRRAHRGRTARSPHHARARAVRLRAHVRRVAHGVRTRDLSWPLLRRHIRPGLSRSSPTCSSNGRSPPHMEATKPALPHAPQRTQSVRKRLLVSRRPPATGRVVAAVKRRARAAIAYSPHSGLDEHEQRPMRDTGGSTATAFDMRASPPAPSSRPLRTTDARLRRSSADARLGRTTSRSSRSGVLITDGDGSVPHLTGPSRRCVQQPM